MRKTLPLILLMIITPGFSSISDITNSGEVILSSKFGKTDTERLAKIYQTNIFEKYNLSERYPTELSRFSFQQTPEFERMKKETIEAIEFANGRKKHLLIDDFGISKQPIISDYVLKKSSFVLNVSFLEFDFQISSPSFSNYLKDDAFHSGYLMKVTNISLANEIENSRPYIWLLFRIKNIEVGKRIDFKLSKMHDCIEFVVDKLYLYNSKTSEILYETSGF